MPRRTLIALVLLLAVPGMLRAATVRVTVGGVPLRSSPAATARVLARVEKGAILDLVDVVRDWYKVRDPRTKTEGYVLASLVELLPGDAAAGQPGEPAGGGAAGPGKRAPGTAAPVRRAAVVKPGEWRDAGFFTIGGSFESKPAAFTYAFNPPEYAYAEEAVLNAHHPLRAGAAFDVGGGIRAWRNLALGATVSVFSRSSPMTLDGTVPHPLYLDRDRVVSGTFSSARTETSLHIQATWVVPASPRVTLSLAGGPSYIRVAQGIARGINLSTVYPFDTTEITGAQTTNTSRGGVGFNAGGDVVYFFTRALGVGAVARFSRASVTFPTASGRVTTHAGAAQAGVAFRIRLGPAGPRTPPKGPARAPAPPPRK